MLHEFGCRHPVAASTGYQEPSLVFLAGTNTRFTDADGAADFLRGGSCAVAFVDAPQEREFALRAEAIGLRYDRGPRIEGYNISVGKPITIAVFQSAGARNGMGRRRRPTKRQWYAAPIPLAGNAGSIGFAAMR